MPRLRVAAAILGVAGLLGAVAWVLAPEKPRPDVVLIVWDTCRADRISATGYKVDTTPWLREFARDAVLYEEAYTPAPWTPPAHASMFTGLLPMHHGLLHGRGDHVDSRIPLLATTLRDAGYETVAITCNSYVSSLTGLDAGFDRLIPIWSEQEGIGKSPRALEEVRNWLRDRRPPGSGAKRRPLFLFINLMDTHLPWTPLPEDVRAVLGGAAPTKDVERALALTEKDAVAHLLGVKRVDAATLAGASRAYDAAMHQLDRATGEIALRLRAAGILDDAFVAVVGDHGEHLGEHGRMSHQMSLGREVLHVPMAVRWPGRLDGGRVEKAQVRIQDLYPTILEAARVPVPAGTGKDATTLAESPLRSRVHRASFQRPLPFLQEAKNVFGDADPAAFRDFDVSLFSVQDPADAPHPRKLIVRERAAGDGAAVVAGAEMFDTAADPGETRNLLADPSPDDRAAVERLRALR
jgi:arylsulfatase A-like enzyme